MKTREKTALKPDYCRAYCTREVMAKIRTPFLSADSPRVSFASAVTDGLHLTPRVSVVNFHNMCTCDCYHRR